MNLSKGYKFINKVSSGLVLGRVFVNGQICLLELSF
jgi:hypothetical protein